jgi:peptidylprolyl isomerase
MKPIQIGDRVQVHYVKRLSDGSAASSRNRAPLELTAGDEHPRLPGLRSALVGLFLGESVTVSVPPEQAYGPYDAGRVRRWARSRFPQDQMLAAGKRVQVNDTRGRRRTVRVLEVRGKTVLVDTNHRFAGQTLELEVKIVQIRGQDDDPSASVPEARDGTAAPLREEPSHDVGGEA